MPLRRLQIAWRAIERRSDHETVIECYYKAAIRPGVVLQPDLQYIASPSGIQRNALVVGLRFVLTL